VLKEFREKAIEFLDNITRNSDSKKEQEQIEKRIIDILQNQQSTLEQLDTHLGQLKQKARELEEEIKVKRIECERSEKRVESLNNAKPAHFNEQRALEAELSQIYRIYVEKIRNHDFLSSQLEKYLKIEEDINMIRNKEIKNKRNQIEAFDRQMLHDANEDINGDFDNQEDFYENYQQEALNKNVVIC
jgi:predicted RNase H-like nuclease (RuvC/YqgF family)